MGANLVPGVGGVVVCDVAKEVGLGLEKCFSDYGKLGCERIQHAGTLKTTPGKVGEVEVREYAFDAAGQVA